MGRLCAKASSQYGEAIEAVGFTEPFIMSCWYKATTFTTSPIMFSISSGVTSGAKLSFTTGGAAQIVNTDSSGTNGIKNTSNSVATGVWAHALAVCTSSSSRTVYLNGTGSATDTTAITLSGLGRYVVGAGYTTSSRVFYSDGIIAECAVWDALMTAGDLAALAAGVSPSCILRSHLKFYAPLFGSNSPEINRMGTAVTLGAAGAAPTAAEHPRIYYPGRSVEVVF